MFQTQMAWQKNRSAFIQLVCQSDKRQAFVSFFYEFLTLTKDQILGYICY